MARDLVKSDRLKISILLILLSLFSVSLSLFRFIYSDSLKFISLNWNLFLAFIPWFLSSIIILKKLQHNKILLTLLMFAWMVFFPNAPYILTDLFYIGKTPNAPVWFDLVMILSFALTGLLFGFVSLLDIEKIFSKYLGKSKMVFAVIGFLFLSSFGIYVGRFLRWNSWDVFSQPVPLFADIYHRFSNPLSHPKAWGLTILLGILLNLLYFSFKFIRIPKD